MLHRLHELFLIVGTVRDSGIGTYVHVLRVCFTLLLTCYVICVKVLVECFLQDRKRLATDTVLAATTCSLYADDKGIVIVSFLNLH